MDIRHDFFEFIQTIKSDNSSKIQYGENNFNNHHSSINNIFSKLKYKNVLYKTVYFRKQIRFSKNNKRISLYCIKKYI